MASYQDFHLSPETMRAIEQMGFTQPTEIQEKAIPVMLEGKEIIAKAPTGTGKTCAFGIPIVEKVDQNDPAVQAVILCPTRELSLQIVEELRQLAAFRPMLKVAAVYGGQQIDRQINALKRGAQIVVATPGRMLDHLHRRTINLSKVRIAVLDEADEMLDMGFYKDVCKILDRLPNTLIISLVSLAIALAVGLVCGIASALRQYSAMDYVLTVLTLIGTSIPIFWFALMLILLFSNTLGWLPNYGMGTMEKGLWDVISHMIMPCICLAIAPMAKITRMTRASMIE